MNKILDFKNRNSAFVLLGHLSFLALLLGSVYFYKERVLFADSAFQFFKIINFEKINIEAARYGSILPQLPLLTAIKLGLDLKLLAIVYSASFTVLYYLIFLACVYLLKNTTAALSVILTFVLCVSQSFFHPVTETHQSLIFSVLLYAILQYSAFRKPVLQFILAAVVMVIAFLAHPVALYPVVFIIGYVAIDKRQFRSFIPYTLLILASALAISKVMLTDENSYEGKFFSELLNSPSVIFSLPEAYSTKFFMTRAAHLYLWVILLEVILLLYFIRKKNYLKLGWQAGTIGFFMLITLLTYNKGDSDMMMERAFMPLALFVSLPFLKEITENQPSFRFLKLVFLTFIIAFSFHRIYAQGEDFWERTRFNQQLLAKTAEYPNRKFIIESSELQKHHLIYWSYSFETLILSTITADIPTQTIFPANNPGQLKNYTEEAKDVFLGADFWLEWGIGSLNPRYFKLPSDLPYLLVKMDSL